MRRALLLTIALAAVWASSTAAEPLAAGGTYDIANLMEAAEQSFDLRTTDAVLLLDSEFVRLCPDGRRETTIHRIVRIATELAIEEYADVRVPYDSETSSLTVEALRTWRDGRWWPDATEISPTAVVETTPSALSYADDYTNVRETVLLHDGIELPCIIETRYTVSERRPPGLGADGLWVFAKDDPAVVSRFAVAVPSGIELKFAGVGAPEPTVTSAPTGEVEYVWETAPVDRLPRPLNEDPTDEAPYVVWSTWESWDALADALLASFDDAAVLSDALKDSVSEFAERQPTVWSVAEAVADFVGETTRVVRYPERFWAFSPRPAWRTWETAYGHRLDRAVLAAALFREAGCTATPTFVGRGYREIDPAVPSLARFQGIALSVLGPGLAAIYDPVEGTLAHGKAPVWGRAVWRLDDPSATPAPRCRPGVSELELVLTVEPDEEDGWTGTGFLRATNALSPYGRMIGLADEAKSYLGSLAECVIPGSEIIDWNVLVLEEEEVACGFSFSLELDEPDCEGRLHLVLASPAEGALGALPPNVHTYGERRRSSVRLVGPVTQTLTLRLKARDHELVYLPAPTTIENSVGSFVLTSDDGDNGQVTVTRTLAIRERTVEPARWPELRALLLEETDERNGLLLLE